MGRLGWLFDQPNAAQRSQPGWLAIENTAWNPAFRSK
jgi:hypothetical protein